MTYPTITKHTNVIYTIGIVLVYVPSKLRKEQDRVAYVKKSYHDYILEKIAKEKSYAA